MTPKRHRCLGFFMYLTLCPFTATSPTGSISAAGNTYSCCLLLSWIFEPGAPRKCVCVDTHIIHFSIPISRLPCPTIFNAARCRTNVIHSFANPMVVCTPSNCFPPRGFPPTIPFYTTFIPQHRSSKWVHLFRCSHR